jgi:hypothetical protein
VVRERTGAWSARGQAELEIELYFFRSGLEIQGGSDISGTLSKLHHRIKKSTVLLIISHLSVSVLFRSGNKNKRTHSSKNKLTRRYETCHRIEAVVATDSHFIE